MRITKYNAICNLGNNINEIFAKALLGDNSCFEYSKEYIKEKTLRLGSIKTNLPQIELDNYNARCNQILLKVLEPLEVEKLDKNTTAIVCATTNTAVEEFEQTRNYKFAEIGNPAEFVKDYFGFKNFYTSVSTACSSGIKAFIIAKELLDSNYAEKVLVLGVDSLAKLPLFGFNSLEILSSSPTNPFSKNRSGINIGEGAAAFIVKKDGDGIEIAGLGETTDYYHSTTPDPSGVEAINAIKEALGNIKPCEIDYINLHGTGTVANDLMEATAISAVFGEKVPSSTTKPLTGHCLGAAASIEIALCAKLIETNSEKLFPHIYDGEYDLDIPKINLVKKNKIYNPTKTCLCTSFGFGGTNCAITLRRV